MANAVGTIYFGHQSAQTLPRALQMFVNEYSEAVFNVFSQGIDTKTSIRQASTAG
jgi:hypothetical protein